ncbi:MAG TPA: carboxypeptidase regulatory-like domain-containing protein [Terriglobia bacterium]
MQKTEGNKVNSRRLGLGALMAVALLLAASTVGLAQVYYGGIAGTVTDVSGASIPKAQVTVTNTGTTTALTAIANEIGAYHVGNLVPGIYSVKTEISGFQTSVVDNVKVDIGTDTTVNVALQVGQVTQQVTVEAKAPVLQTTNATVGTQIGNQTVTEMPLNGRSFTQLLELVPGSVSTGNSFQISGSNYQISGNRSGSNMFQLDGIYNNEEFFGQYAMQPPIDSIQEFKVETNITSAEYGRAAGAAIAVATKSGTNQFHGAAWEFLRNNDLDANAWFNNFFNAPLGAYRQNQFGVVAGGPVYFPHLYNGKDKTFWFFSYEGLRFASNSLNTATAPTATELSGNFASNLGSQLMTCGVNKNSACVDALGRPVDANEVYNPYTTRSVTAGQVDPTTGLVAQTTGNVRDPFPGNTIPSGMVSPITAAYAGIWYPSTSGLSSPNSFNSNPNTINQYQLSGRIDHSFGSKVNSYFRVSDQHAVNPSPQGLPVNYYYLYNQFVNAVASATWVKSPTTIIDFKSGYNRANLTNFSNDPAPGVASFLSTYPIQGTPIKSTTTPLFPAFNFGSYYTNPSTSGNPFITNVWQELLNITMERGKHEIKTGAEYEHYNAYYDGTFTSQFNFDQVPTQDPLTSTGSNINEVASYLLGLPSSGLRNVGDTAAYFHQNTPGLYIQDNYKPTTKLTVNMGLRWEYNQWPFDKYNHLGNYYVDQHMLAWAGPNPVTGQPANAPRSLMNPDYRNWAPRVGFAYQLRPNTVLRGGFGYFYNGDYAWAGQGARGQWPYAISQSINSVNTLQPTLPLATFFPPYDFPQPGTPPSEEHVQALNNRTPYTRQWNLGIQQQLARNLMLEVNYVGNNAKNLGGFFNANDPPPGPLQICPDAGPTVCTTQAIAAGTVKTRPSFPYAPTLTSLSENANNAVSNYNGLQVKLDKRFSSGTQALVTYTWSHLLDTPSGDNYGGTSPENDLCRYCDYGNSANNYAQIFTAQWLEDLPFGHGRRWGSNFNRAEDLLLGGWEFTGIYHYNSGFPINIGVPSDLANAGQRGNSQRPNYVGGPTTMSTFTNDPTNPNNGIRILNVNAYSLPENCSGGSCVLPSGGYQFGTLGRYAQVGPHFNNVDLGLFKNFPFSEGKRSVQFRAEFFNAFNIHDFGGINGTCCEANNAAFADTTSVQQANAFNPTGARIIQFALKVYF